MPSEQKGLGPYAYFKQISAIPRESGNEKAISDYLVAFAVNHRLNCRQDEHFNVIIEKPASRGRENISPVFIQAHMDMVCEKKPESIHDFSKDGIVLLEDGDFIRARDTSLGADNGIGMAMLLQILEDEFEHPPITALFTVDEERGLVGVKNIDLSLYPGTRLINLDGEAEGIILASCAGALRCTLNLQVKTEPYIKTETTRELLIAVQGLKGGHSGLEIDRERANAIILLNRILLHISKNITCRVITLEGGNKENSIPANAQAVIGFDQKDELEIRKLISTETTAFCMEYSATDPDIIVEAHEVHDVFETYTACESMHTLLNLLLLLPNGLIKKDLIHNASLTSSNVGVLRLESDRVLVSAMVRSNIDHLKYHVTRQFGALAALTGATLDLKNDYPAWEYRSDSKLREHFINVYLAEFGHKPIVQSIHGGLECAYFAQKKANIDMVSIGCNIYDVHSVHERFSLSSAIRTYKYLKTVLETLS